MEEAQERPRLEQAERWLFHEDNLATSRAGIYLLGQSLLFSAIPRASTRLLVSFAVMGALLALIWLIEALRAKRNISACFDDVVATQDRQVGELINRMHDPMNAGFHRNELLVALPVIAFVAWLAIPVIVLRA
jgi:hypothetical protein